MAEETQPKPSEPEVAATSGAAAEEVEVKGEVVAAEEKKDEALDVAIEDSVEKEGEGVAESVSLKEESNVVADLEDPEKKALDELKSLIQAALANNEFTPPPPPPPPAVEETPAVAVAVAVEEPEKKEAGEKTEETPKPEEEPTAPVTEEKSIAIEEDGSKTVEESVTPTPAAEPTAEVAAAEEIGEPTAEVAAAAEEIGEPTAEVAAAEEIGEPTAEVEAAEPEAPSPTPPEEIFIWGVPLLGDEKSDTVLLKFLQARDFKAKDALAMLKNSVIWRKQFGADALVEADLEVPEFEKAVFYHGLDKEGHPVCYNVYGEFEDKELYVKAFGDEEKRERFLRWRIQFLEKGIRQQLDFTPGAVSTMVQVNDLKNLLGPGKKELKAATKKAVDLLQDNYPEFAAKQIFINVPWWYLAYNRMISPFFTQRSKSKFVFAGPSKSADTLFKYIAPEQVPVQYGGLSKEVDQDFTPADSVTEFTIKPASKHTIELPVTEGDLVWEFRVLGWEVSYGAEFVPSAEDGYTVIVQKTRKFVPTDEPYVKNSFKIGEAGKLVLTIDNATSKKKKLLYRSKVKSAAESV